jgi:hypothetical protein
LESLKDVQPSSERLRVIHAFLDNITSTTICADASTAAVIRTLQYEILLVVKFDFVSFISYLRKTTNDSITEKLTR